MISKLLSTLVSLALLQGAFAVPSGFSPSAMHLPHEAKAVAVDELNKRFIAFDHAGRELGVYAMNAALPVKRDAGTCTPMSSDDIKNLPGIQRLRDEATTRWGKGKRREVVNDKDLTGSPANICADDAGAVIIYDGTPSCKDITNKASGTLEGGKITLENNEGINMSINTEVTKTGSFAIGTSISTKFSFPEIVEVSAEISTTSTFTNTQGEAHTVGADQRTLQRIEQPVDEGQSDCQVSLMTKSCSITGKGSMKMIAQGMLWFEYEDRTQGHYKWGLVMEAILPNVDDRSSAIGFKTTGNIESSGHFTSSGCTKGETVLKA